MLIKAQRQALTDWPPRRAFPDAVTFRCFAFEPSESQMQHAAMPNLMPFPPGATCRASACSAGFSRLDHEEQKMQSSKIVHSQ